MKTCIAKISGTNIHKHTVLSTSRCDTVYTFVPDMKLHIFFLVLIAVSSALEETMSLEERGDADATLLKRCHGEFKGALVEKRSLADISELSVILKRCLIGGSRSGKV